MGNTSLVSFRAWQVYDEWVCDPIVTALWACECVAMADFKQLAKGMVTVALLSAVCLFIYFCKFPGNGVDTNYTHCVP